MDHGVSVGPIQGLIDMKAIVQAVANGGSNAVIMHKGLVRSSHRESGKDVGLIIHLSGSTSLSIYPNAKTLVCSVEEAIKIGADAVSIHINLGDELERIMLKDMGQVAKDASDWGMPLVAMVYPRGEKVKNEYDVNAIKHAARVGSELGADLVKVSYTGSPESFAQVVQGCHVPVLIAGGPKMDSDEDILKMVHGAIQAGASGVSIGRNIFQHRNPELMVKAMSKIVHENSTLEEALSLLS
jgi:class I fructose-bisphosphate aldolase